MRWVIVRVLPVPAPARMQTGPVTACAAVRCSSSRPASTASAPAIVPALWPTCGIPVPPLLAVLPRSSQPPATVPGSIPRWPTFPLVGHPVQTRVGPTPIRSGRIPTDDCRCLRRDHVHHHVLRLLLPAQEA